MTPEPTPLDQVYAARNQVELADAYAAWSNDYDRQTAAMGYCLPFVIAGWVARHVPGDAAALLDVGCGTGLSGPVLCALGYQRLEGLDLSSEMLAIAAARGCHRRLERAVLGGALPWPDAYFSAFVSAGVFTEKHAPASSLDELCRITAPGGHAVFTVRDVVLERGGFSEAFRRLKAEGTWEPIEESPPFRAFAVAEPEVKVKAFVFRMK